jgi:hypothetical protein
MYVALCTFAANGSCKPTQPPTVCTALSIKSLFAKTVKICHTEVQRLRKKTKLLSKIQIPRKADL